MTKHINFCLVALVLAGMTLSVKVIPALAAPVEAEIELLKKMLTDLERKKDEEINELKKRIAALEQETQKSPAPPAAASEAPPDEVKEVKQEVATLTGRLENFIEKHKLKAGLRMQAWYQFMEDGKAAGAGRKDLDDFMLRRFYFYLQGEAFPGFGFFAHIAGDRLGQDGLDQPSVGLGTSIAVRDAWVYYKLGEPLTIQLGRMYIPFTRNYGTTSTFGLLPLELAFNQGGVRGGIFYYSKVGRDDGVVLWGNPWGGLIQYRLGVFDGVEGAANPDDNLRLAGRLSLSLLEPETSWFNQGTYLGQKKVLSLGTGFDYQNNLTLNNRPDENNLGWTVDLFFDHPIGKGALTAEAAYINVKNMTQTLGYSWLTAGEDAQMFYIQGGYLLPWQLGPGKLQPYCRYERLFVKNRPDTYFPSFGLNYYLKGQKAKLSVDWTQITQEEDHAPSGNYSGGDQNLVTVQGQVGF
ncbi:MAG: hypothetical protein BZ151_01730 [Desulfobacca sp. 4484_104]|nr:MAG: hypothetical protein BZ151_01730 [Desulfobacca sp. 4484_104]RLA88806.1 MAG: hypothetical protein DRG58_07005 [Deltaproteobacteria bacterium]